MISQSCCDHVVLMQTQQVSEIMKAARRDGCSASIAMQCYQQLYTMLGDVDTGSVAETCAVLTMHQAATTAATLKGRSWHHTKPHQECSPRRQLHICEAAGSWQASMHTCCAHVACISYIHTCCCMHQEILAVASIDTEVLWHAPTHTCCGKHQY